MGRWCDMDSNCQHEIEPGHMGGNCKLCEWSEIAEWYGMYDISTPLDKTNNEKQLNGEQHTEQINYEIHDNGN